MRATWILVLAMGAARAAGPEKPPSSEVPGKAGLYLMLPEPRAMRSANSRPHGQAQRTVFTPAHQMPDGKVRPWTKDEFARMGISWETCLDRAQDAADRRLAAMTPELKADAAGRILYAVYRGEEEVVACLLVAPSLGTIFKKIFGEEVWLAAPDRHSLYVFPAGEKVIGEFAEDLEQRFEDNPFAATDEIFAVKSGTPLRAVGSFRTAR